MGLFGLFRKKGSESVSIKFDTYSDISKNSLVDKSKENSDSDFSNAVFLSMLSQRPKPIGTCPDDYPRYVLTELNIYDPVKKHMDFIQKGFLRKATPEEALATYKVIDLKKILDSIGIKTTVRKRSDLIDAIKSNVSLDELELTPLYCVSDSGLAFIGEHSDLIKLHGNPYNISYEEYSTIKAESPAYLSYNDIVWRIINEREMNPFYTKRSVAYDRAVFLYSEKRFADSLYFYISVLLYDIHDPTFDEIPPGIKEKLVELKEYYTKDILDKCYNRVDIREKVSKQQFSEILNNIFNDAKS